MTMFILLAIVSVIHGGNCDVTPSPPHYVEDHREILEAIHAVEINVLSMADHIPLLNDSRRHYAEIVYVLYSAALETGKGNVGANYTKILETTSVEALSNPRKVVETIKKVYNDLETSTKTLQELIKSVIVMGLKDDAADSLIDLFVKAAPEKYDAQVKLHIASGNAAKQYNAKNDLFNKMSKELLSHKFLVTKFETLMDLILATSHITKLLYPSSKV